MASMPACLSLSADDFHSSEPVALPTTPYNLSDLPGMCFMKAKYLSCAFDISCCLSAVQLR